MSLRSRSILLFVVVCPLTCAAAQPVAQERPNILVILADDLGYSDLACYGGEIPTPHIDGLARHGLRFTQVYNSARCCPSRAALVTGLYPHQAGIGSFVTDKPEPGRGPAYLGRLNDECVTFAQVLKAAGYQTYMVGKWHVNTPGPIARGFDEFFGFVHGHSHDQWNPRAYQRLPKDHPPEIAYPEGKFYATDAFSDYALEFLRQAHKDTQRPWLLYLAYSAPHFPLGAPPELTAQFVPTYRRGWDVLREERFARQKQIGLATDAWTLTPRSLVPLGQSEERTSGYAGQENPAWDTLTMERREDLAHRMAIFAAMVARMDEGVGRVVDFLTKSGQLDNTLIVFLSDNGACFEWGPYGFDEEAQRVPESPHTGEALARMGGPGTYLAYGSAWANLGNTPLRMYKHFDHEGGICTPMIVHWPRGIKTPDRWVRTPSVIMDIMPTLCDVAGAKYPERWNEHAITPVEGTSLGPIFGGGELPERPLFFEHQGSRAMRQGKWKIVWSKNEPREIEWELYDLDADRCETHDLAAQFPERTAKMAADWLAWAKRVKVDPFYKEESAPRP